MSSSRVEALHAYGILDTPPEEAFDRFVEHAADLLDVPIAAINFVDAERQWAKAAIGIDIQETERTISFCAHTIQDASPLIIQDAAEDERFEANPLVVDPPHVRFYAGTPLETTEGYRVGTLCVLDTRPRVFTDSQVQQLRTLAKMVVDRLEQRREALQREKELRESEARYRVLASHFPNGLVALFDSNLRYQLVRGQGLEAHGLAPEMLEGRRVQDLFDEPLSSVLAKHYRGALQGNTSSFEVTHQDRRHRLHVVPVGEDGAYGMAMSQDITEAEEYRHQLDTLVDNLPGIVYRARLEEEWPLEFIKGDVEGITGYTASELLDKMGGGILVHPDDRAYVKRTVDAGVRRDGHYDLTFRILTKQGETRWIWERGAKVRDPISGAERLEGFLTDVTEREKARQTVRERESRLRGVASSIPGVVFQFAIDDSGNQEIRFVGNSAERLLGIPANPSRYGDFLSCIPAPYLDMLIASVWEAVEEQHIWEHVFPYDHPHTGERIWLQGISLPADAEAANTGKEIVYNGVVIDITARKKREQEREAMRERMELALEKTDAVLFEVDFSEEEEAVVRMGPFERLFGIERDKVKSLEAFLAKVVHPEDRSALRSFLARLKSPDPKTQTITYRTHPDRGAVRWIRGEVHQVEHTEAGTWRLIGLERDVTAQKEAQKERRMLAAAVEQASEAVLITEAAPIDNPGPRIIYANPAFEAMTGYEIDEIVGKTPRILQGPDTDSAVLERLRTHLQNEKPFRGETVNYRKDGTPYIVRWDIAPVRNAHNEVEYWVSVQYDVTDERRREQELRTAKKEAEKAARLQEAMLANMSHEVRTPLTSMIGFTEILRDETNGVPAEHAAIIHRSSKRLHRTLESMLQLSELRGGAYELSLDDVDLRALAAEVVETMHSKATRSGVALQLMEPDYSVQAHVDPIAVQRIITNLVDNAIKFTPENGQVSVQVGTGNEDVDHDGHYIEVRDTGIGIAPEAVNDMFTAFKQESDGFSRTHEGSGLGLAIVKQLVDQMDGTIIVESEKGQGTCMHVSFPAQSSEEER